MTCQHPFHPGGLQLISSGFTLYPQTLIKEVSGRSLAEILIDDHPELKAVKSFSRLKATRSINVDMDD